jgi:ribonuclease D
MNSPTPITSPAQLEPLLRAVESADEVCLDTEADSLHHYREKLCLLQFSIAPADAPRSTTNFLVDPLADFDLQPLFAALAGKLLVLHGADYDLRMLQKDFSFVPSRIYDTMLAARLAGHPGLGLDALVQRYVGQTLDHAQQKADWSQRPLPPRMIAYAVNDTRFLPLIAGELRKELDGLGRTEWHQQQCEQLIGIAAAPVARDDDEAWRIKGSSSFERPALAVLRELWIWRDEEARRWDRPPFMVCGSRQLLDWALWASAQPHPSLSHLPHAPKHWRPQRFKAFEAALRRAWEMQPAEWPAPPPRPKRTRSSPGFSERHDALRAARDEIANKIGIEPFLLATTAQIIAVAARNPRQIQDFNDIERWLPWQTEVLGQVFLEAIKPHSS